mmetsp:Transcript_61238/g.181112  ORF Transcript_61238/g.181112 Transcript_61238/m.181112 type:complete len:232 (-) Transcript_61238:389-1084(-)
MTSSTVERYARVSASPSPFSTPPPPPSASISGARDAASSSVFADGAGGFFNSSSSASRATRTARPFGSTPGGHPARMCVRRASISALFDAALRSSSSASMATRTARPSGSTPGGQPARMCVRRASIWSRRSFGFPAFPASASASARACASSGDVSASPTAMPRRTLGAAFAAAAAVADSPTRRRFAVVQGISPRDRVRTTGEEEAVVVVVVVFPPTETIVRLPDVRAFRSR